MANVHGIARAAYNKPNPNLRIGKEKTTEPRLKMVSNDGLRTVIYRPITEQVLRVLSSQDGNVSPLSIACKLMQGDNVLYRRDNGETFTVYLD